ncbi:MAG: molybdopterin-dependent oxidoreductase, partial [Candidatus Aminicenantales bacterium]
MSLKRRDFLKIAGGLSLGAPLYNCSLKRISDSAAKSRWLSPLERWIPTVCQGCPGGCGILARVIDDRVVKVEGNPLHPLNRGKVCPKGQAGLQALYHPDRIKSPLKKTGNRNSGRWEAVSWEEALDDVASRLKELRGSGKSHTVVFLGQNFQKATEDLVIRFLQAYGTPNYIKFDDWLTIKKAHLATQGIFDLLAVDLERTKLVLSFGADFLTNWPVSIENQRIYGEKRSNRDITIFHVEPRFSLCASRADRWIPINPGTEALFALGVASVIVKEKLYDEAYIRKFTLHFEEFEEILLKSIRLDRVSDLTGVPLRVLIEIAKEFSTQKPAVAVADHNLSYSSKGYFSALAIHHLNALVGSIDVPGGLLRQRKAPLKKISPPALDEVARKGLSQPRIDGSTEDKFSPVQDKTKTFCENVIKKNPYGIHCLFLLNQNPLL